MLPSLFFPQKNYLLRLYSLYLLLFLLKLTAAIVFISIGVIAAFFCAIVDGIIASEFIVSEPCFYIPALSPDTQSHKVWSNLQRSVEASQGWHRLISQIENFVDAIGANQNKPGRTDSLISVADLQRAAGSPKSSAYLQLDWLNATKSFLLSTFYSNCKICCVTEKKLSGSCWLLNMATAEETNDKFRYCSKTVQVNEGMI